MCHKLYESYLELWGTITHGFFNLCEKTIEKNQDDYKLGFLMGYNDGYKEGLQEEITN